MATPPRRSSQPHGTIPRYIHPDITPPPMTVAYVGEGESRHMDVEETLRVMALNIQQMRTATMAPGEVMAPVFDEKAVAEYEKKIERAGRWGGWIWGLVSVLALIFTAGMSYAIFMGENATDSEVEAAGKAVIIDHNGGIDPEAVDAETHKPVGHHPDMRKAIESNSESLKTIEEDVLPPIVNTQKKLDKRSEYQYELTRWQNEIAEAKRQKKKPPQKPKRVRDLESDLTLGKY